MQNGKREVQRRDTGIEKENKRRIDRKIATVGAIKIRTSPVAARLMVSWTTLPTTSSPLRATSTLIGSTFSPSTISTSSSFATTPLVSAGLPGTWQREQHKIVRFNDARNIFTLNDTRNIDALNHTRNCVTVNDAQNIVALNDMRSAPCVCREFQVSAVGATEDHHNAKRSSTLRSVCDQRPSIFSGQHHKRLVTFWVHARP